MLEQIYGKARHYKVGGVIPPKLAEILANIPRGPTSGIPNPYAPGEMRAFGGYGQGSPAMVSRIKESMAKDAVNGNATTQSVQEPVPTNPIQGNDSIYWGGSTPGGSPSWAPSVGGGVDPYLPVAGAPGVPGAPGAGVGVSQPSPGMGSGGDGGQTEPGNDSYGRTPDDPYYGGASDFATGNSNGLSYGLTNGMYNYGIDGAGALFGPVGEGLANLVTGINPLPGTGNYIPGTDIYNPEFLDNFGGPGEAVTDLYGLGSGEQRDMLIEQGFLTEDPGLFGGMFGDGQTADPDQQFFGSQQEAMDWYNNGVAVANADTDDAKEAVSVANDYTDIQDSSFGTHEEAQAVADHGFGSDEHFAAIDAGFDSTDSSDGGYGGDSDDGGAGWGNDGTGDDGFGGFSDDSDGFGE